MATNAWYECDLDKEGNPSIYTLKGRSETRVNEDMKIRKCEIGSDSSRYVGEKVIMFIGETGTGKTTMINSAANFLLGIDWEDNRRYQLNLDDDEQKQKSETSSKTQWISSYKFHQTKGFGYKVTLVDTPGFGHTDWKTKDNHLTSQIHAFFRTRGDEGIDHIDAIAFVVKASSVRLTEAQLRIFKSVLELFGKDIEENIFLFATRAELTETISGQVPVMEAVQVADIPIRDVLICNNHVLFYQKQNTKGDSAMSLDMAQKFSWEAGRKNMKKFFDTLNYCNPKSISLSTEVLNERRNLEATAEGLPHLITSCLVEMNRLKKEESVLEEHRKEMDSNLDFTYEVEEEQAREIELEGGREATVCTKCRRTCHYPCKRNMFIHLMGLRMCAVMRYFPEFRGCGVCLEHCEVSAHSLGPVMFEREIVTVTKTEEDIKRRYEMARNNMNNAEALVAVIKERQLTAKQDVDKCVERLRNCLRRLDQIALRSDPFSLVKSLYALKQKEMEEKKPGWQERLTELDAIYQNEVERVSCEWGADHHWVINAMKNPWGAFKKWKRGGKKETVEHVKDIDGKDSCIN